MVASMPSRYRTPSVELPSRPTVSPVTSLPPTRMAMATGMSGGSRIAIDTSPPWRARGALEGRRPVAGGGVDADQCRRGVRLTQATAVRVRAHRAPIAVAFAASCRSATGLAVALHPASVAGILTGVAILYTTGLLVAA